MGLDKRLCGLAYVAYLAASSNHQAIRHPIRNQPADPWLKHAGNVIASAESALRSAAASRLSARSCRTRTSRQCKKDAALKGNHHLATVELDISDAGYRTVSPLSGLLLIPSVPVEKKASGLERWPIGS